MAPRESILVYARYFEANASADGNTQATCQALADAGYMTPDANGSFKRRLDFPTSVVSVYQGGFTSLVDINLTTDPGALVVQHGVFGAQGFAPNTGQIRRVAGQGSSVAVDNLNLPTDLVQMDAHTYYVSSLTGTVMKVTY